MSKNSALRRWLLPFAAFAAAMTVPCWPQVTRGTLRGTVTDPTGAVIPGASVTLVNAGTQEKRTQQTSEAGTYTFAELVPGTYEMGVSAGGFKEYAQSGITVRVGDVTSLSIAMQVGSPTEKITVTADAPLLKADSSDVGTTMASNSILDLPLQVGGQVRNPVQFLQLTPGFAGGVANSPTSSGEFRINGGENRGVDILVDGATIQLVSPTSQMTYGVSVEGVQEFKVLTGTFSAEFGRTSGAVVTLVQKSGDNKLRGSVYDIFRNNVLDANNWWANYRGQKRPVANQNDFGYLLSGPVYIPKVYNGKDKTFFMTNYEGFRFRNGGVGLSTYPTEAMKAGDFSVLLPKTVIYDPKTCVQGICQPFEANMIPAARLSSVSKKANELLPQTMNNETVRNILIGSTSNTTTDIWTIKIDQMITANQRLSGSISRDYQWIVSSSTRGPLYDGKYNQNTIYPRLAYDYVISPTLLNHATFGFSRRFRQELDGAGTFGQNIPERIGLKGVMQTTWPCVTYDPFGRYWGCGASQFADNTYQINESVSWVRGRHSLKFGYEQRMQQFNSRRLTYTSSDISFGPLQTSDGKNGGYGFASYMLGLVNVGNLNLGRVTGSRFKYYGAYVQDDFKVSRKLTLNLGARWDVGTPATEPADRFSIFDPKLPNPGADGYPGAYTFFGTGPGRNGKSGPQDTWWKAIGPRVGLAYQLRPSTVVRSGYGIYYGALKEPNWGDTSGLGFFGQAGFTSPGGIAPAFNWDDGFPQNFAHPPFIDPTVANGQSGTAAWVDNQVARPSTTQNWTLDIQQQIGKNLMVDVAYVGTHVDHIEAPRRPNQVDPTYMSKGACLNVNILSQTTDSRCAGQAPIPLPYPSFKGSVGQALRPFPQVGDMQPYTSFTANPFGFSTYHALQVRVEKRLSYGLTLMGSYTFSKNIAGGGAGLDQFNQGLTKAITGVDIPNRVITAFDYELPIGPGHALLNRKGVAGQLFGGWHVAGVLEYRSGTPVSASVSGVDTGIFNQGGNRPNIVGGVNQMGYSGDFDPFRDKFLNINAFSRPAPFTIGNEGPVLPNIRAFPVLNEDMNFGKRFKVTESFNVDFRAELFNVFNRHIWSTPPLSISDPNTFGIVTGSSGARRGQLMLKINF